MYVLWAPYKKYIIQGNKSDRPVFTYPGHYLREGGVWGDDKGMGVEYGRIKYIIYTLEGGWVTAVEGGKQGAMSGLAEENAEVEGKEEDRLWGGLTASLLWLIKFDEVEKNLRIAIYWWY